jgi:hypothetical protein
MRHLIRVRQRVAALAEMKQDRAALEDREVAVGQPRRLPNLSALPTLEDLSADIRTSDREYIDYWRGSIAASWPFVFTDGVPARCARL